MADLLIVKATAKGIRMTPRKIGEVASLIRGRSVADALVILDHTPRRAATPVAKLIKSAQANATHNHRLQADSLRIDSLQVTAGPRIKRFRAGAMGRAKPYQKRSAHIFVTVSGLEKPKKAAAKVTKKVADNKEAK